MSLEQVKSEVIEEAENKAEQLEQEAEKFKEQKLDEASEKARKIKEEKQEEIEEWKEKYRKEQISNARMKAREIKLEAKKKEIDSVFASFRKTLSQLDESERKAFVESCLEKVEFEPGKAEASEEYIEFLEQREIDTEVKEDIEGVILISETGERRIDFSFDKILKHFKQDYRKQVAEKLLEK
ncbi:MAG: V-type ATP synthase subunit E family protein [Candidatus Nanohaloarchaea archaeon]